MRVVIILTILALMIFSTVYSEAYATKYNMIVITLSEVCKRMNDNNISGCPSVSELVGFDNSNQAISGKFVTHDNSTQRTNPQLKNHYMWYQDYSLPVVCVDCNADFINGDLVKQVIIEPHDFVWTDTTAAQTTHTFVQYHGRFFDGCQTSTLSYDWNLMTDTIYYMRHGCDPKATDYNNTLVFTTPSAIIDYENATQIKYQKNLDAIKGTVPTKDCRYVKCDETVTGKKW